MKSKSILADWKNILDSSIFAFRASKCTFGQGLSGWFLGVYFGLHSKTYVLFLLLYCMTLEIL